MVEGREPRSNLLWMSSAPSDRLLSRRVALRDLRRRLPTRQQLSWVRRRWPSQAWPRERACARCGGCAQAGTLPPRPARSRFRAPPPSREARAESHLSDLPKNLVMLGVTQLALMRGPAFAGERGHRPAHADGRLRPAGFGSDGGAAAGQGGCGILISTGYWSIKDGARTQIRARATADRTWLQPLGDAIVAATRIDTTESLRQYTFPALTQNRR